MNRLELCIGVLGVVLGSACDRGHRTAPSADAGEEAATPAAEDVDASETSPDADAGEDAPQPDATSALDAAVPVDAAAPPARGCEVIRSIELPDFEPVVRVPGGFVQGPTFQLADRNATVSWLAVSEDGLRRLDFTVTSRSPNILGLLPLGSDPFTGLALAISWMGTGSDEHVWAEVLSAEGPSSLHELGPAFYRGTIQRGSAAAFAGTRAVYVTGHIAVDNPHAFVIDESGERVGAVVPLMEQASPSFSCLQVVPTQRGAAVSYIDNENPTQPELKIFGLSEQAQVQESATVVLRGSTCPFMHAAEDGIFVNVVDPPSNFDLRILRGTELTTLATELPPADDGLQPVWLHQRGPDDLLFLFLVEGGGYRMDRLKGGEWTQVDADLPPLGEVVPAEPGRLFVMSRSSLDDGAELHEIGCGDLDT